MVFHATRLPFWSLSLHGRRSKQLNWTEEEQRIFWTRLAGGACNVGHFDFSRVAKCVALPHGPVQFPDMRGNSSAMTALPSWFVTGLVATLEHAGLLEFFPWVRESHLCRRMPKIHACLVAHGLMDSVAVCDMS